MMPVRVLPVDDEPLALERLVDLIGQIDDVEIVGSAAGGADAIAAIRRNKPDVVLLDIEMPKVDGFDVVETLVRQDWPGEHSTPLICFVTAYPQFALEAYETGALDFLCKPVRLSRLEKAISRARTAIEQREAAERLKQLSGQLESLRQTRLPEDERCLWIQRRGNMVRIEIAKLDWIQAEGEYVRLHVGDTSHLLRTPISHLSRRLESEGFVQIHRSLVINRERLRAVRASRGGVKALLSSGAELPVGRKYRHLVQAIVAD